MGVEGEVEGDGGMGDLGRDADDAYLVCSDRELLGPGMLVQPQNWPAQRLRIRAEDVLVVTIGSWRAAACLPIRKRRGRAKGEPMDNCVMVAIAGPRCFTPVVPNAGVSCSADCHYRQRC